MACSIDHLNKVALEGFPLIDEFYGRQGTGKAAHRYANAPSSPPQRNQDQYHHQNRQLVPNQYVYHGPQAVTYVQQPETASYHQIQTNKSYERWYVCEVSQAPGGASINSNDAAAFYGGMLINDKGKTKQKQWS
ncbi:hypothetical protein PTKIN_Ptkin10aG0015000 [Pterospermum kingtungense]